MLWFVWPGEVTWLCMNLQDWLALVPSSWPFYLVSCEKVHTVFAWTICNLLTLHLPEAARNLAREMIFHSCLETPGGVSGFLCIYLMLVADSQCYWMLIKHNFYHDFNSFYYRVRFGSIVSLSSVRMGFRNSLQAGRIPYYDVPDWQLLCVCFWGSCCWMGRDHSLAMQKLKPGFSQPSFSIHSEYPSWKQTLLPSHCKEVALLNSVLDPSGLYFELFTAQETWADTCLWMRATEVTWFVL